MDLREAINDCETLAAFEIGMYDGFMMKPQKIVADVHERIERVKARIAKLEAENSN